MTIFLTDPFWSSVLALGLICVVLIVAVELK